MTNRDGNGWTRCGRGHRHWGRHGAAGLLLAAPDEAGRQTVLLQQRSWWGSYAGAWGPPGGARDSHESVMRAALREAIEECAIDPRSVRVHGVATDDHGGWTYQTVLASAAAPLAAAAVSEETSEVAWVPVAEVERLRLHPGFAGLWPALQTALLPLTVIVDAANVMGSRPDGWWRDRAGAAGAGEVPTDRQVQIVLARGSGDDEIARQAAETAGPCLVVTADRELRSRCEAAGAGVVGPRWLLDLL